MTFTIVILIIIAVIYFLSKSKKDNDYIGPGYQKWKAENEERIRIKNTVPDQSNSSQKLKLKIEGDLEDTYIIPTIDIKHDKIIFCKSSSDPKIKYEVNLYNLTCTCPDFIESRSALPKNDIRRICKHIRKVFEKPGVGASIDDLCLIIIKNITDLHPRSHRERLFFSFDVNGSPIVVSFRIGNPNPWFDVFAKQPYKKEYMKYGYNPIEDRWSYNDRPAYEDAVIREFRKVVSLI